MAGPGPTVIGGRYQLQRPLGAGGMAEVWLAIDLRLNAKQVAVKRLHGFRAGAPNASTDLERARREAFAASRLNHPNLVAVTDFIAEHGEPFIVMEYVEGRTLDEVCRGAGLPIHQAAHLLGQVAAALSEAHAAHIVHRDIKPANIMVTPRGDAKLADFGIARSPDDPRYTATGAFTGTMRYMAPEVLDGTPAGPAADVWALGATLYEAVEGRPAFDAPTNVALIAAIAMGPVPAVTRSPELAAVVARMLDRDPARRPSATEVAARLRPLSLPATSGPTTPWDARLAGATPRSDVPPSDTTVRVTPRPPGPPARPRSRPKKRTRAWMIVAVPVVIAATAGGIVLATTGGGGNEPVAGGNPPTGVRTSSNNGVGPPQHTSSAPVVGSEPTLPSGGSASGSATVHFAGVTVEHAREPGREPVVTTDGAPPPATLQVKDLIVGDGAPTRPHATVMVRYLDVLYADGSQLDASWPQPTAFDLDGTVAGFRAGVIGDGTIGPMRAGGRRLIVVPPVLGYGEKPQGDVPANSTLVFVVELVSSS